MFKREQEDWSCVSVRQAVRRVTVLFFVLSIQTKKNQNIKTNMNIAIVATATLGNCGGHSQRIHGSSTTVTLGSRVVEAVLNEYMIAQGEDTRRTTAANSR